jgi:tripartite-type tricarboxylate transporter receptor subunit TctC
MLLMKCPLIAVLLTSFAVPAAAALAQSYPTHPIRAIVPYAPGGGTDVAARPVAIRLSERLGQQIVIDNRAGANGNIGTEIAAHAQPDGYTLLFGSTGPQAINPSLYTKLPFDVVRDFAPVAMISQAIYLLVANPGLPAATVSEFIQVAKSGNHKLVQASSGIGSPAHLAGEMLKIMTQANFVHVPYKGGGPAAAAVIAGEASFMFIEITVGTPFINAGRLRLIATATPKRVGKLPNTPTMAEAGLAGFDVTGWTALFAPAGTPRPIIDRLNSEVRSVLKLTDIQERLALDGSEFGDNSPQFLGTLLKAEIAKYAKLVKVSGARVD